MKEKYIAPELEVERFDTVVLNLDGSHSGGTFEEEDPFGT